MPSTTSRLRRRHLPRPLAALAVALAVGAASIQAAESAAAAPGAHARVGFERIRFPGDERVGLVGTSYLVDVGALPGLAIGPAVYGAISGRHGGFFTVGGEVAWRRQLAGPLGTELGLYVGGGGGGGAPPGSGLMLRPHADLLWDFGPYALGLSVSRVRFPNGQIDSTQVGLVLHAIGSFRHVPAAQLGSPLRGRGRDGAGFDRVQFVSGVVQPRAGTTLVDGSAAPRHIALLGVRAEQALTASTYWGIEANSAAESRVARYTEFLGTLGLESEIVRNRVNVGARVALGMAGGGGVRTAGGSLVKAAVYSVFRLSPDVGLSVEAGVTDAPRGDFRAAQLSAAVVWALDGPDAAGAPARPARTDFSAGLAAFDAPRRDGRTRALRQSVLKIDRYLWPNFYLSGQVGSAVAGGAGGYASALLGAGWHQPLGRGWHVGAELLGGASGGGNVESGGRLLQPSAHVGYQLTPGVALRLGAGRAEGAGGRLSSTVVQASVVVSYGVSAGS